MLTRQVCRCMRKPPKAFVEWCRFASAANENTDEEFTHFGYETIRKNEKTQKVNEVFHKVASKYDLMNDVMSAGIHRLWKDKFVGVLNPNQNTILLDAAGGTGDIAFRTLNYVKTKSSVEPEVTVCDLNSDMLDVGKERAKKQNLDLKWVCGSADDLPFPDESFTAYTISFGIRNCTDINKVLEEAYRVLKPGGRFLCLEFSHVPNSMLRSVYDAYSFQVIPVMGEVIAADWKAYQYLAESIRKFPKQKDFADMIESVGFKEVTFENLTFGVCAIHSGFKI
uniref:2-methoxy-6-polyprenyl-1,4-benzoquinol methylase, mitochondrial n=1 Tax=Phallusia mammillata TaxID=59560 RepID=A0A6F9DAG4_9ASCI|nr:2-methoxy-6-polyprenyl-1,4-benzoquinol methylase, mitochondrial-like [Phallusia mammillata]